MTRKRFKKLMMSIGVERNGLGSKLHAGSSYRGLTLVFFSQMLLNPDSTPVEISSAMTGLYALLSKNNGKVAQAFGTISKYNSSNLLGKIIMSNNAEKFIRKYADLRYNLENYARDTLRVTQVSEQHSA